ncbi:MAG: histidinol-phosphate transaminase [Bacteroidota bacterium]
MRNIDRRQWLKAAGLTGSLAFFGGASNAASNLVEFPAKRVFAPNGMAKLNSNENPFGPSDSVRKAITESFDRACRYPFGALQGLIDMIADKEGVSREHIVVTGGSTEGLNATGLTYAVGGGEIIAAHPTFQAMLRYAEGFGAYVHRVPVNDAMEHDLEAIALRMTGKTRLIFLCNPNNPTGTLLDADKVRDFCDSISERAVVFSDEAYYDFITTPDYPSMTELVREGKNVIVSKTFSKVYGLAGIRVGYLVARPDIAERLRGNVMANTNILGIAAAKQALKDDDFYKFSVAKNAEAKQHIYGVLDDLKLDYIKSQTNFIFFHTGRHINEMISAMKRENVWIGRPFPPMFEWARISTGTMEEVKAFGNALKKVMA